MTPTEINVAEALHRRINPDLDFKSQGEAYANSLLRAAEIGIEIVLGSSQETAHARLMRWSGQYTSSQLQLMRSRQLDELLPKWRTDGQ